MSYVLKKMNMNPPCRLWPTLETIPGHRAVLSEWKSKLGSDFATFRDLLIPTHDFAEAIPDPGNRWASYRVVRHGPNDIVGVHDYDGSVIALSKTDIVVYRLNHIQLFDRLCHAFGFDHNSSLCDGTPQSYRLGTYCPLAGYSFPVFVTFPLSSSALRQCVESVHAFDDGHSLVLAPTRQRMQPACESVLKKRGSLFVSLSESVQIDDRGVWAMSSTMTRQLDVFKHSAIPQASSDGTIAFFPTPANATWSDVHIKFLDGETVSVKVGPVSEVYVYSQMGMADGRSAKPTKQWDLLRSLANDYGLLTWNSKNAHSTNQKRRETLAKNLKHFFRIEGDPIDYRGDEKGWKTRFQIEPDS